MIKLVLTDMDDTLIPAGHDGASDYAIEGIHAMQAAVCTLARFRVASRPRWAGCSKIVPECFRLVRSVTAK